jgi:hypothetical protein
MAVVRSLDVILKNTGISGGLCTEESPELTNVLKTLIWLVCSE